MHAVTQQRFLKKVFATLNVGNQSVKFQLDCGATCNIIPAKFLESSIGSCKLQETDKILSMYNKPIVKPIGQCRISMMNPKTHKYYKVYFVVIDVSCVPLLGSSSAQEMGLIEVKYENIIISNSIA